MKKAYTKPRLFAETFELLEHIASCKTGAGDHAPTVSYRSGDACTYTDANLTLFYPENSGCTNGYYDPNDDSMYDSFDDYLASFGVDRGGCYNAFSDGNFFAS